MLVEKLLWGFMSSAGVLLSALAGRLAVIKIEGAAHTWANHILNFSNAIN